MLALRATVLTEGTANFLADRRMAGRMAEPQQMRWPRRGADLLLQVRCSVYNGAFVSGFGQRSEPVLGSDPQWANAA